MANDIDDIMPKILARGLMVLRERAIMPRIVNSDYSIEAAQKGNTIDVPIGADVNVVDVTPGSTPPASVDTTMSKIAISLDQWKKNEPIHLTDKHLVEIDKDAHFLPPQLENAVKALANNVNEYIFSFYKGVYGFVGTEGTTPFATVSDATQARKVLNQQLCPKKDRRGTLDFAADANALDLSPFSDAEKIMSKDVKIEGDIGRKYGIDWFADDAVPTHTAGTITDGGAGRTCAVNLIAGYAAGLDTIAVDEGAAGTVVGTILVGDIISFANHDQTYAVIANASSAQFAAGVYTFAADNIDALKFQPALKEALVDNEIVTVKETHVVNMAFHRDAFAYATRPLVENTIQFSSGNNQIMSLQDQQTGLVLRLEVSRQYKQVAWEFDILYGAQLVHPEMAVRIAG